MQEGNSEVEQDGDEAGRDLSGRLCLGCRVLLGAGSCDSSSLPRESVLLLDGLGDKALVDFEVFGVDLVVIRLLDRRGGLGIKVCVVFVVLVVIVVVAALRVSRGVRRR